MAINEFGEIVRSGSEASNRSSGSSASESGEHSADSFSSSVIDQFQAARRKNFNIITLLIGVPLYTVIGYFAIQYFYIEGATEWTGAAIGGIASLVVMLIYNCVIAKKYEGYEYLISLLSPGIALGIVAFAIVVVSAVVAIILAILEAVIGIVLVFALLAGLGGG